MANPSFPVEVPAGPVSLDVESLTLRNYIEEQLASVWRGPEHHHVTLVVSHLTQGVPADQIVQLASDLEADLIVVGTHGRRGVRRLVLGSIAEKVVRLAPCPVLVERPKAPFEEEDSPQIEPPCPHCVDTRFATHGVEFWCSQHRERHGRRHTYHVRDLPRAFPSDHGGLGSVT